MHCYHNNSYIREEDEDDLYPLNRQALDKAADDEGIERINWKKWDESIKRFHRQNKRLIFGPPSKKIKRSPAYKIIQYDAKTNLKIREYPSLKDVIRRGLSMNGVASSIRRDKPYKGKYIFKKIKYHNDDDAKNIPNKAK